MFFLSALAQAAIALVLQRRDWLDATAPVDNAIVVLDYSSFQGAAVGNVTQYLGMPFAQPPVKNLRFRLPQLPQHKTGVQDATSFGAACPQKTLSSIPGINFTGNYASISEDCLTINVFVPTATKPNAKLPVAYWMHGGGFEIGDSSDTDLRPVVERSIVIGEPMVIVTSNYRINALGFLAGKEAQAAGIGNIGLHDQRFALEWIQRHIASFGGDRDKVIIWGLSAGSFSVGMHLVADDGNSAHLFRGAFMDSGGIFGAPPMEEAQEAYNVIVSNTGCISAPDTLQCLREVDIQKLMDAIDLTPDLFAYSSLGNVWKPRVDGQLIKMNPLCAMRQGSYVKVPFIAGDCDDEGTLFSLSNTNVTTNLEFLEYIQQYYLSGTTSSQIEEVGKLYPETAAEGSPFDTGTTNQMTPQFKRLAAFQGDVLFQAPRRLLLQEASQTQDAWSYLYKRGKATPYLGTSHASDTKVWFARNATDTYAVDAFIYFVANLDPNHKSFLSNTTFWPRWQASQSPPPTLTFTDPDGLSISADNFRTQQLETLTGLLIGMAERANEC